MAMEVHEREKDEVTLETIRAARHHSSLLNALLSKVRVSDLFAASKLYCGCDMSIAVSGICQSSPSIAHMVNYYAKDCIHSVSVHQTSVLLALQPYRTVHIATQLVDHDPILHDST